MQICVSGNRLLIVRTGCHAQIWCGCWGGEPACGRGNNACGDGRDASAHGRHPLHCKAHCEAHLRQLRASCRAAAAAAAAAANAGSLARAGRAAVAVRDGTGLHPPSGSTRAACGHTLWTPIAVRPGPGVILIRRELQRLNHVSSELTSVCFVGGFAPCCERCAPFVCGKGAANSQFTGKFSYCGRILCYYCPGQFLLFSRSSFMPCSRRRRKLRGGKAQRSQSRPSHRRMDSLTGTGEDRVCRCICAMALRGGADGGRVTSPRVTACHPRCKAWRHVIRDMQA